MVLWLGNEDIKKVFDMNECLSVVENTYREQGEGQIVNREPPRTHIYLPTSKPDVKYVFKSTDGGLPRLGTQVIRITSDTLGYKMVQGERRRFKFPSLKGGTRYFGLYLLFRSEDGMPLAMLHDGHINHLGVGARVGIGVKYLARQNADTVGLFGAGWYGITVLGATQQVRKLRKVKVYSPTPENRKRFAEEASKQLELEVVPADSAEETVRGSSIILTMTNAAGAVFDGKWLDEGSCVVTAAGGDHLESREELDEETLRKCELRSVATRAFAVFIKAYKDSVAKGVFNWDQVPELGEIIVGKKPGRANERQCAVFFQNLPGGSQHCGMATRVYELAKKAGLGKELADDLFLQDMKP
jgi:alanine dehydrogenase